MIPVVADDHPASQELAAYARGELGELADRQIEEHLEQCDACCRTLNDLSSDSMVDLLRRPGPASPETCAFAAAGEQITLVPPAEQATILPRGESTRSDENASSHAVAGLPPELVAHSRYEILKLLGQGGMGNVYQAQHRMMNRLVALKVINQQLVQNDTAVRRFHREVRAAARLSHPNIVAAYDAEQAGQVHYLVMEYVAGVDLAEVVRRRGPLSVAQACDYARQAALGLQYAHELGMVHRDIKPQNLMLAGGENEGERGVVKILDFGLAQFAAESTESAGAPPPDSAVAPKPATHLTLSGAMMGTPDYISPEQARDAHSADIRADIYSLGCTLYCLLAGAPPFAEGSALDKVMAHVERDPRRLAELRSDIPAGLEEVLRRMMAKSPAERFQTPGEVAVALAPFVGAGIPPLGGEDRPKPELQRSRAPLVPLAVAATLFLTIFAALGVTVVVVTDRGRLVIESEVSDVQLVVKQGGKEVAMIDLATGSQVRWLPSGKYELELVGDQNDITLDSQGFQMTRLGNRVITAKWNTAGTGIVRSFNFADKPITQDSVTKEEGGWKIAADTARTVRLFEVADPQLAPGRFFYRAKLKTENVKGRAYLEMWVRVPGQGESFSKGFHNAVSGTNGWAEYEIPFLLKKGESPDLVKLNVTVEGTGAVWIKDVELRGRSAPPSVVTPLPLPEPKKKPEDGAAIKTPAAPRHIKDLDFGRWVGRWETTFEYQPTADTKERTAKGVTTSRLMLDDRFLFSRWKGEGADAEEYAWLLTFDENVGVYRYWVFASNGQAFERADKWDEKSQTLGLDLKPPSPGVKGKSSERFVSGEQIDGTLVVKNPDGTITRDVRFTSLRKSPDVPADTTVLTRAGGPAALPEELSLLNKMAGFWSIRSTEKPSVWAPEGKEETFDENVEWVLGGRFLAFRAYDTDKRTTSFSLMTYEPAEKAYRFWFFGLGGVSGQWRITWDASSRGFHWRSIDMPPGWIGTGFNRWIDDDTFDNEALIKDDKGDVLLDGRQLKKRVKNRYPPGRDPFGS